jgi:hypothetical protein
MVLTHSHLSGTIRNIARSVGRYLIYYLKNTILFLIFSPMLIMAVIILFALSFMNWVHHNPHPKQSEEDYERANYYPPHW